MEKKSLHFILTKGEECAQLAHELLAVLEKERSGLIGFDIEKITQSTIEKSFLVKRLTLKRKDLKRLMALTSEVSAEAQEQLENQKRKWDGLFEQVILKCQSNQGLLKHSLKNIDLLLGNLKTLFGNPSVYDQKGKKQDMSRSGKVVEGRF